MQKLVILLVGCIGAFSCSSVDIHPRLVTGNQTEKTTTISPAQARFIAASKELSESVQKIYENDVRLAANTTAESATALKAQDRLCLIASAEALIASNRAWELFRESDGHYEYVLGGASSESAESMYDRMTFLTKWRNYEVRTPYLQGRNSPFKLPQEVPTCDDINSTNGQRDCAFKSHQAQRYALSRLIELMTKTLSPSAREALISSQNAWGSFMEAESYYVYGYPHTASLTCNGSGSAGSASSNSSDMTALRIYQLGRSFRDGWNELNEQLPNFALAEGGALPWPLTDAERKEVFLELSLSLQRSKAPEASQLRRALENQWRSEVSTEDLTPYIGEWRSDDDRNTLWTVRDRNELTRDYYTVGFERVNGKLKALDLEVNTVHAKTPVFMKTPARSSTDSDVGLKAR